MTDYDKTNYEAIINALVAQRNEWMDRWVSAQGELAVLKKMLHERTEESQ